MSITPQIAPSSLSRHEGIVLGLLVLIVAIRLVESKRLPNAWAAVFGGPSLASQAKANATPTQGAAGNNAAPWTAPAVSPTTTTKG